MKVLVIFCFVLLSTGCTSMKSYYLSPAVLYDLPPLNQERKVSVGDEMVVHGMVTDMTYLEVVKTINGTCYTIPPGIYLKKGEDEEKDYFDNEGYPFDVAHSNLCDPHTGMYVAKESPDKVCVITIYGWDSCYEGDFRIDKEIVPVEEFLHRALYYSGKFGNIIELKYIERQYGRVVRKHDASYNLAESAIIEYRGLKIQILNATGSNITYKLLGTFPNTKQQRIPKREVPKSESVDI